jgi:uncharacterized protein (TIGR03067 family)
MGESDFSETQAMTDIRRAEQFSFSCCQHELQGRRRYNSFEMDGQMMPPEQLAKMSITYTGDKWVVVREGDKIVVAGTQKLDPTKRPRQIDSLITEGEGKGTTMLGIYELKGDTFRVCFDPQGKERPKDFIPQPGQFVGVIRREKK